MTRKIFLFDMDGVLLIPSGYHEALKSSVKRIGLALGLPFSDLTDEHIARYEVLGITNEWDTLAICTALMLIKVWQTNPDVRLKTISANKTVLSTQSPQYDPFLDSFKDIGGLPTRSAYEKIISDHSFLGQNQITHLKDILYNARDIYQSVTLPIHQETVLGSQVYQKHYQLKPQLGIESYLMVYDKPALNPEMRKTLRERLSDKDHYAGIMTNRPSDIPPGYLSSPEAEAGAQLVGLRDMPLLGSGMLGWFATTQCDLPDHLFLKPNPIHALGLMQMCYGEPIKKALSLAYDLWRGLGDRKDWEKFNQTTVYVFEDAVKGFDSGKNAKQLLAQKQIDIDLRLIGVSKSPIKEAALQSFADQTFSDINQIDWDNL